MHSQGSHYALDMATMSFGALLKAKKVLAAEEPSELSEGSSDEETGDDHSEEEHTREERKEEKKHKEKRANKHA